MRREEFKTRRGSGRSVVNPHHALQVGAAPQASCEETDVQSSGGLATGFAAAVEHAGPEEDNILLQERRSRLVWSVCSAS